MTFFDWPLLAIFTEVFLVFAGALCGIMLWRGRRIWKVVGVVGIFCIVWGAFIEPSLLVVREDIVQDEALQGLRVGVVSDFHVGIFRSSKSVARVVETLNELDIDAVLIPGDFLYGMATEAINELNPLSQLKIPVFATLGNHDHRYKGKDPGAEVLRKKLQSIGVHELENTSFEFQKNLWFAGVDDDYLGFDDLESAFNKIPDTASVILLAHTPDIIQKQRSSRANFIVAGHTHGGQIRMPWGSIPFVIPVDNPRNDQGLFLQEKLLVTSGVGESGTRVRFLNPPEIRILSFIPLKK